MAAIALAESGGNPNATNPTDNGGTQTSWGLWQISNGTHGQPANNILSPAVNAQQAVAKYKQQGLGAWGTYTSGAYKQFFSSKTPASALPQGGGGGGGSGSGPAQDAQLAAWWNPVSDIQDLGSAVGASAKFLTTPFTNFGSSVSALSGIGTGVVSLANDAGALLKDLEWLFVPSHWVRIFAFGTGVFFLLPGLYELSHAGRGDMSLAMGIGLTTLAGVAFFIAFHNLPTDITGLADLLAYISAALRGEPWAGTSPASTAPAPKVNTTPLPAGIGADPFGAAA
jgi:hypothetical protein